MRTVRRTRSYLAPLGVAFAAALSGCSSVAGPDEDILTLEVDAQTQTCTGEMVQECLRVRAPGETEWRLFYDTIEGFTYEPGFRYVLQVARRTVADPPMDGSSFAYRLLEVLSRDAADSG